MDGNLSRPILLPNGGAIVTGGALGDAEVVAVDRRPQLIGPAAQRQHVGQGVLQHQRGVGVLVGIGHHAAHRSHVERVAPRQPLQMVEQKPQLLIDGRVAAIRDFRYVPYIAREAAIEFPAAGEEIDMR